MSKLSGPLVVIPGTNTPNNNKIQLAKIGSDHTNPTVNLEFLGAANAAAANVPRVTNASFGQASVITIPDPGAATASFVLTAGAVAPVMSSGLTISGGSLALTNSVLLLESFTDNITAATTQTQAAATQLTTEVNRVTTVATVGNGVKLPASAAGLTIFIINHGVNAMQVYGLSSDTIDDVAAATGISQMQGSVALYTCTTAGAWYSEGVGTGYAGQLQTVATATGISANAAGTKAAATPLTQSVNNVTVVGGAGYSVGLPLAAQGLSIVVSNNTATSLTVFTAASSTDTINSLATTVGLAVPANTITVFYCMTTAPAGLWLTK